MKKMRIFLPILVAVMSIVLFSQCEKDHSCSMRITCKYSENDSVAPFAVITFDTSKYVAGPAVDSNITCVSLDTAYNNLDSIFVLCSSADTSSYRYKADNNGVFTYTLRYPALIKVDVTKVKKDTLGNYIKYFGTANVKVSEGETTEETIMLVKTN